MQRSSSADPKLLSLDPTSRCRILSVSADRSLLDTRQLLLEQAGALVYSVGFRAAALMAATDHFDIVLLCHTLLTWEVTCLRSLAAHHHPACRFVSIDNLSQVRLQDSAAGQIVAWSCGPRELIQYILSGSAGAVPSQLRAF